MATYDDQAPSGHAPPRYRMRYRPVSFCTLPPGLQGWSWVELPPDLRAWRSDLPLSEWRFGVFSTSRPLTTRELEDFEIERVDV